MHPLYGALPMPHMCQCGLHAVLWSPCRTSVYVLMRLLSAEPRSMHRSTFIPLSVSLWNDLAYNVFDGVGLSGFKSRANVFFIGLSCSIPFVVNYFSIIFFLSICWYCGAMVFGLTGCRSLSPCLAQTTSFNNKKSFKFCPHTDTLLRT